MSFQSGLFTDLYSLTMMQGYFLKKRNYSVTFDMFIRNPNHHMGYMVFAGLEPLINQILTLSFSQEDIEYLRNQKLFTEEFLSYLSTFSFTGNLWAMAEGSVCFPQEPIIKVQANIIEAQIIEGLILNTINFQTLIATKASRICKAAMNLKVIEFGLRRAHGPNGALYASRASFIGGCSATSNVLAGKTWNIPITGTMSHSWVMSYKDEYQAFEEFSELYPNISILLDTHNTLESGLPNAIKLGKKLISKGINFSVRLDSGDIEYLSRRVRNSLNNNNMQQVKIIATNDLDEAIITQILSNKAPIDIIGVGTNLVTGGNCTAMPGVYKISEIEDNQKKRPIIKTSNNIAKSSLPSNKQVYRFITDQYVGDLITLENEKIDPNKTIACNHPFLEHQYNIISPPYTYKPLLMQYITQGVLTQDLPSLHAIQYFVKEEMSLLDNTYLRLINPHEYHVSISNELKKLRDSLIFNTRTNTEN